jgi:hypothetical protein
MDLVALERAAFDHVLYEHGITFDGLDRPRPAYLEEAGADAASTLISLAVELAQAIKEPEWGSSSKGATPVDDHRGLRLSRNAATRTVSARLVWSARPTGPPPPQSRLQRWAKVSREIRPVKCPVNERRIQGLCTGQISAVSDLLIGCARLHRSARTTLTVRRE